MKRLVLLILCLFPPEVFGQSKTMMADTATGFYLAPTNVFFRNMIITNVIEARYGNFTNMFVHGQTNNGHVMPFFSESFQLGTEPRSWLEVWSVIHGFSDEDSAFSATIKASELEESYQWLLPKSQGVDRGVLTNSGVGILGWWNPQLGQNIVAINNESITVTNHIALLGGSAVRLAAAPTNTVTVTNRFGLVHVSSASVLAFDFNQSHEYVQTNRVTGVQSIILTNGADGQTMSGILLGEVAGGTSRVMTFIPNTGQLIEQVGDYTTGLATSTTVTLTNGLSLEWSSKVRMVNGTNIHHFAFAFYKH